MNESQQCNDCDVDNIGMKLFNIPYTWQKLVHVPNDKNNYTYSLQKLKIVYGFDWKQLEKQDKSWGFNTTWCRKDHEKVRKYAKDSK